MERKLRLKPLLIALIIIFTSCISVFAKDFSDTGNHWAKTVIDWATKQEIIQGYEDNTFKPDKAISKAEFLRMVNQSTTAKSLDVSKDTTSFKDVPKDKWYHDEVVKSLKSGYIKDTGGDLKADESITRAEAFTIFAKAKSYELSPNSLSSYSDANEMTEEERGYTGACIKAGVIHGYPDAKIRPKKSLTRAEVVQMFYNASGNKGEAKGSLFPDNVWSFTNSGKNFGKGFTLNSKEAAAFKKIYSETDWAKIEKEINSDWGGSCFGFTATVDLMNSKLINFAGLNDGNIPTLSKVKVETAYRPQSLINFYQLCQYTREYRNSVAQGEESGTVISWQSDFAEENWGPTENTVKDLTNKTKAMIDKYKNGGNHVQAGIYWYDGGYPGGHAALAYDYEDMGGGKTKVLIYDPNYNYEDGKIHSYIVMDSNKGEILGQDFGFNSDQIADGGINFFYVCFSNDPKIFHKDNPRTQSALQAMLFDRVKKPINIEMDGKNYKSNEKHKNIVVSGIPQGALIYKFASKPNVVKVTPIGSNKLNYSLDYGDKVLQAEADSGKSATFRSNDSVEIDAPGSKFNASITKNSPDGNFKYNTIKVKGNDGGNVKLTKDSQGYKVTGTNLKGAEINGISNKSEILDTVTVKTNDKEVFLSSDSTGLIAKVDTNGDGVPDKEIDRSDGSSGSDESGGNVGANDGVNTIFKNMKGKQPFNSINYSAPSNKAPSKNRQFDTNRPVIIYKIGVVMHGNTSGPGKIIVEQVGGSYYAEEQAYAAPHTINGVTNPKGLWVVESNLVLPEGTYRIRTSDPANTTNNAESGYAAQVIVDMDFHTGP